MTTPEPGALSGISSILLALVTAQQDHFQSRSLTQTTSRSYMASLCYESPGTCLFRLYGSPSGGSSEVLVLVIPKHGSRKWHELEVGGDLPSVAQDEVHLLLLSIKSLANLCTCGLQLAPEHNAGVENSAELEC